MTSRQAAPDTDRIEELETRVEALESRFETFERLFSSDVIDKADAHSAEKNDAREQFEQGEVHEVVVEKIEQEYNGITGVSHIDGVVTFIDPRKFDIQTGDLVTIRISDVKENTLHAISIDRS